MTNLKHAVRMLLKRPAFTLLAVFTLAVGIGANTAIFSVVNGVLLRPLPYPQPDRIVTLWEHTSRASQVSVSYPNFRDWHDRVSTFSALAAYEGGRATVLGGAEPVFADVYAVTHDFFAVLGITPEVGRTFAADEMQPGGPPSAVVSHRFWERQLRANRDLASLHLNVEGISARIVGVMPARFSFPEGADVWVPKELSPDGSGRTGHNLDVVGRLRAPFDRASADLAVVAAQLQREHPGDDDAQSITMMALQDALTDGSRSTLLLLLGAVGLVLLIACANVASTMFARGEERRVELAIRAALGADRRRLVGQLLVESLLLGGLGAAAGLLLAGWLVRAFLALNTSAIPRREAIGMDTSVLLFALALALVTPLIFGIFPALHASRPDLRDTIAEAGRGSHTSMRGRVRAVLVALEVSVALVLLVGSTLLLLSFWHVLSVDAGFDARDVLTMEMAVPRTKYPEPARSATFYTRLVDQLHTVPGVQAAGAITVLPLSGTRASGGFYLQGDADPKHAGRVAVYRVVTPEYFAAMRIPVIAGRLMGAQDRPAAEIVATVNQEFVRQYSAGRNPLGLRFRYFGMDSMNEPWMTIVGVVGNVRTASLVHDVSPEVYVSYQQRPNRTLGTMSVAVRSGSGIDSASLAPSLRAAVAAVDPDVPVEFATMTERVGRSIADRRFTAAVLSAFAGVALLLAAVGIYSVLSHSVAQRTSEIGIRMALGADGRSVVRLMVGHAMGSVAVGIAAGAIASALTVRLLRAFLFAVRPMDPVAFILAAGVLTMVALLAAYVPARRATRIDPLAALRMP